MKLKVKFLTMAIAITFFAVIFNSLVAVGTVYQVIAKWDDNKLNLVYRTVAKPYHSTLDYFRAYNEWFYDRGTTEEPDWASYKSNYVVYTKYMIGKYEENSTYADGNPIGIGYSQFKITDQGTADFLSNDPAKVESWINGMGVVTHIKHVKVTDNSKVPFYTYSYNNAANPIVSDMNLSQDAFNEYNKNTISSVGESKVFTDLFSNKTYMNSGYSWVSPVSNTYPISGVAPFEYYREMLYTTSSDIKDKRPSSSDNNTNTLYLMDVIIKPNIVSQLYNYSCQDGKCNDIYVSAIPATYSTWVGGKFYILTPGAFVHSKARDFNGNIGWSRSTLGANDADKGLGAGLNLWDNILRLPENVQKDKKIVVNHIAVKVDSVGNKTFELIKTNTETLKLGNSKGTYNSVDSLYIDNGGALTTNNSGGLDKLLLQKTRIQNDMQQYTIKAPKKETWYKVEKLTNLESGYTYVGNTVDKDSKIANITEYYFRDKYNATNGGECEFQISNDENEVIVNMYYEMGVKKVFVEHVVCKDVVNKTGCTMIEGNRQIDIELPNKSNTRTTLYWTGSTLVELYYVNNEYNVYAQRVKSEDYEYKEFELKVKEPGASDSTLKLIGYGSAYVCIATAAETKNKETTITFYYVRKGTEVISNYEKKPDIEIPGTLSILSAIGVDKNCSDGTYSVPTNAKTGENDVYVGIRNTPTYILAGINVKKQDTKQDDHKVKINLTIRFGPNVKTWAIEVPYSLSYYAIQELLIYKYNIAEIYNTGLANTKGEVLFDRNTLTADPKNTSALTLYSKVKDNISYSDTSNWKNYLKTSFRTNYTVPNNDPYDSIENEYKRNITYNTVLEINSPSQFDKGESILYYGNIVSNNINSYIKAEMSEKYKQIELDSQADISIELLSEEIFRKVNGNGNNTIELADIIKKQDDTNNAKTSFDNARYNYEEKIRDYNEAKNNRDQKEKEKDAAEETFDSEKSTCTSETKVEKVCTTLIGENGETIENCEKVVVNKTCNDCPYCVDSRNAYKKAKKEFEAAQKQLNVAEGKKNAAKNSYNLEKKDLEKLYEIERKALQHFDEAYYIQENLWNVYKNYNTEDIAKLIGLDIKFEYSSDNAKLGYYDLMTVESHELELKSDTSKALNGRILGNNIGKIDLEATRPTLSEAQKKYYTNGIPASWIPENRSGVGSNYYTGNVYEVPITRLNGKRILAGKATYSIDGTNRVGSKASVLDNMYYGITEDKVNNIMKETVFEVRSNSKFSKDYGVKEKNSEEFNIYTPLVVDSSVNQDIDIIDQTEKNEYSNKHVIQSNSTFTVKFSNSKDSIYANNSSKPSDFTSRYKEVTYIKFEFAVTNVKYVGKSGYEQSFGSFEANSWIGPIYGNSVTAVPYLNTTQGQSVTDQTFNYHIISAAVNTRDSWTQQLLSYINTSLDDLENANLKNILYNVCGNEGKGKLSYYADSHGELIIVNRVYDFRVTDLKDIDWKDVFRYNSSSSFVNQHSGIAYYAGLTKWNTKNPLKYNQIIGRTSDEIGSSPTRILPLGPYKNTNTSYISAPKMGYRFSFDLKVTGAINNNKYVEISPKFYYVSKDGNTFYTEGNGGIYLFYKNSQGQYVKIRSTNDKYQIQFTPNDGYRSLIETDVRNLNSSVVTLGSLTKLTLKFSETTTTSINDAAITYYGEYKLPNSTIAVKVDNNGNYDINKPLTNGYIGVVFDIKAHESNGVNLVYGKNSYKGQTNTSQWDYEGYLGLSNPGNSYSTSMKLEKGTWKIDNATYNKIKGTVILYDTDTRASNDFN